CMKIPRCRRVDEVDILALTYCLPSFVAAVLFCFGPARLRETLLRTGNTIGIFVTQYGDLHALDPAYSRNSTRTPVTQPDNADADYFELRRCVSAHVKQLPALSTCYPVGKTLRCLSGERE